MPAGRVARFLVRPALGVGIVFGLYGLMASVRAPSATATGLVIPAADLDLGTLVENRPHEHTLTLTNPGPRPVTVDAAQGPCDWERTGLRLPFVVPAGGRHALKLVLAPSTTSDCGRAKGGEGYQPTLTLRYTADGRREARTWQLRGVLKPTLHVGGGVGGRLWLGEQTVEQLAEPRDLPLVATVPVESVAVSCPGGWLGDVRRGSEPGRFIAAVRRVGGTEPFTFDDLLTFTPTGPDGRPLPATHLRLTGEAVDPVLPEPRAVRLGRKPVGSRATDRFSLRSIDGRVFTAGRVEAPAGVHLRRSDGPEPVFELAADIAAAGDQEFTVIIHTTAPDGREAAARVPVSYLGYTP